MENKQDVQLIFFKDLVFAALYRWKWIVVAALVFALALGGMAVLSENDAVTMNTVSLTPENEARIAQLQFNERRTQQLIQEHSNYLNQSVLMQLDPYAAYTAGFHLSVSAEAPENAQAILRSYRTVLQDSAVLQEFVETPDVPVQYLSELIILEEELDTDDTLTVKVYGISKEEAAAMAESLVRAVQAQTTNLSADFESHTIAVSDFQNGPYVDFSLLEAQNYAHQQLSALKANLVTITTELNSLLPTELLSGSSSPLLFAAVGAVLGIFLVAVIAWVWHIASAKVYSARVLRNRTGVRILGCVQSSQRIGVVDRWLRKLEGRSTYAELDAVAVNIRNRCTDVKQLLLLGHYVESDLAVLVDALEASGIHCILQDDPAVSAATLEALPYCDAAVLVETCARSRYDGVEWEIQIVQDHGKALLGCVLIDG